MIRIGFSGVPSTGKTSTARALAAKCKLMPEFNTVELVQEYARIFITKYGPIHNIQDQYMVTKKQIEWEGLVVPETKMMITDSPVFLGMLYYFELRKLNDNRDTRWVNDFFELLNNINTPQRYDIIFHLPPTENAIDDGVRNTGYLSDDWRQKSDILLRTIFQMFPPKELIVVHDDKLEDRVDFCLNHLKSL